MPNLMWLFFLPCLAAGLILLVPRDFRKIAAGLLSLMPLGLLLFFTLKKSAFEWFPALSIHFAFQMDGVSILFVYLTAIVVPLTLLASHQRSRSFYGLLFLLQGLLFGFFLTTDLVFFTIFWEAMLIPIFLMMTLWGRKKKWSAAIQFIIFMFAGSFLLIAAVLALYLSTGTLELNALAASAANNPYAHWIAAIFLLAFAVKTPLFPFHGWLPETYTQASTSGTILLSALLSKAGIYGFIRVGLGLFPELMRAWSPWLLGLSIAGVLYGALAAWKQSDFKKLLAYSSFSHVNFILAGLFALDETARQGALMQAFNHGITITALFLAAGWLEERLHSTTLGPERGLARYMPLLCWTTFFFVLSSVALPGTNNFAGELLIFFGLFQTHPYLTAILGLIVIFSAVYMLRWMQKIYFEEPSPYQERWVDLRIREMAIALPLILLILWVGLYPMPLLKSMYGE